MDHNYYYYGFFENLAQLKDITEKNLIIIADFNIANLYH